MNVAEALALVYSRQYEPAKVKEIVEALSEPFDEEYIQWKPQTITKDKKKAQAAAYIDTRAAYDRLNDVLGNGGWFDLAEVTFSEEFGKKTGWKDDAVVSPVTKCLATIHLGIVGVGLHSGVGEGWGADDNAYTIAFAQALKRAAVPFGMGRYLYDLPKVYHPIDQWKKFEEPLPELPDWAKPRKPCEQCGERIRKVEVDTPNGPKTFTVDQLIANSMKKYSRKLCAKCQQAAGAAKKAAAGRAVGAANGAPSAVAA
jgi:hypothetical protein